MIFLSASSFCSFFVLVFMDYFSCPPPPTSLTLGPNSIFLQVSATAAAFTLAMMKILTLTSSSPSLTRMYLWSFCIALFTLDGKLKTLHSKFRRLRIVLLFFCSYLQSDLVVQCVGGQLHVQSLAWWRSTYRFARSCKFPSHFPVYFQAIRYFIAFPTLLQIVCGRQERERVFGEGGVYVCLEN